MSIHRVLRLVQGLICCVVLAFGGGSSIAQNLLVQWKFDESAGGSVDAIDTGAPPPTNGVFGTTATRTTDTPGGGPGFALDLSAPGIDSIVSGGDSAEVDGLAQFTFSTWAKVTGTTHYNEGGSVNVRLLSKQTDGTFDGFSWNMNAPATTAGSNNAFRMGLFVGGNLGFHFTFLDTDILDRGGEWLFLAVTYDGTATSQNTRFYLGDETTPVAQIGSTLTIPAGVVNPNSARFGIGFTDAAPTADTSITGYQDDVRVYDGVLDLAALEIARLANLPDPGVLPGDFNGDNAVDAADYVVWRKGLNTTHTPEQYDLWRDNFGRTAGAGTLTSVPEPASLVAAIGLALALFLRRSWFCELAPNHSTSSPFFPPVDTDEHSR